jgi:hypothetical protein
VNPLTVSPETLWLTQNGVREAVSFSLAADGCEVVVSPAAPLRASSRIEIMTTGVEDMSGNTMPSSTIRFRVRAALNSMAARAHIKSGNRRAVGLFSAERRVIAFLIGRR